ncbi:MAG: pilus assembly protein, partial [Candidatus Sericytochromatia bacterium]|nr:pilus assembly protein [Candidatus Sericytochromatia bacterium]
MSRRRQHGQALVETALVIPILVLMVFGTFYVTYAYMQRSIMNGVAFMAARAISVRDPGEASGLAKTVASRMVTNAKLGGSHWLTRAEITGSAADGVHMVEPDGWWSFLARLVGTTAGASAKHASVNVRLYPEWARISDSGGRTQTYHMISYTVNEMDAYEAVLTLIGPVLHSEHDQRIGEPDTFSVVPSAQNGGVGSLGGTIYQRNTAKLEKQKGFIGL